MSVLPRGVEAGANLTIFKKGLILAAIPLLAQLVFLAVLFKMRQDQLMAQESAIHSKNVLAQTEGAFRLVMEAQSSILSLALTGNLAFLDAWEKSRQEALVQLRGVRELVRDNLQQQARVDRIIRDAEAELARLDAVAQLARREETRGEAVSALSQPWAMRFLDDLWSKINDFLKDEERMDDERQKDLEKARSEHTWGQIGGIVLALLSTAVLAYVFRQGIAARLTVLMDNVRRLASGEQLATPLGGRDELGRLDRIFHDLADTLAQKSRDNELFVYSISHDLRSPLVNLQGFSQELTLVCRDIRRLVSDNAVPAAVRDRVAALLDHNANESIQFIQTAVRRLATIIDALLRLSRVGRVVYEWQQVDVRAVVERVAAALGNTSSQKGARVVIGDLPPAWGDATAIEQIFANLIGNALNYLDPARPGVIEVGSQESPPSSPPLRGGDEGGDERRTYYVKDNGVGIETEHVPKLFHAFRRLHPAMAEGEGVGLSLIRRMVERHGGRIWVESAVGQGSTFFLTLPAHPGEEVPANGELSGAWISQRGETSTWQRSRSA
jgi:signal transduction histidine kinase